MSKTPVLVVKASRARLQPSEPQPIIADPILRRRQTDLLFCEDPDQTRSIGLWDLIPLWVLDISHRKGKGAKKLPTIERGFLARGIPYKVLVTPAQISTTEGDKTFERQVYPGAREQRVELVIRKIAADQYRYNESENQLFVEMPLYEVYNELKARGHTLSYPEIVEAIDIMARTILTVSRDGPVRQGEQQVVMKTSPIYLNVDISKNKDGTQLDKMVLSIQMNSLITDSIRKIDFHEMNYDLQMRLEPAALCMFRWMHHTAFYAKVPSQEVRLQASAFMELCGIRQWRLSKQIDDLEADLRQLKKEGIVADYVREDWKTPTAGRHKLIDAEFAITVSQKFMAAIVRAQGGLARMRADWEKETGLAPNESPFLPPVAKAIKPRAPAPRKSRAKSRSEVETAPGFDFGEAV